MKKIWMKNVKYLIEVKIVRKKPQKFEMSQIFSMKSQDFEYKSYSFWIKFQTFR